MHFPLGILLGWLRESMFNNFEVYFHSQHLLVRIFIARI